MNESAAQWPISLETKPVALVMGIGRHGGNRVERYSLGAVWCLHLYRYHGAMRVRGREFPIRPGFAGLTPPQVELEHQFDDPVCVHAFTHFALPAVSDSGLAIPVMQDLGLDAGRLNTAFEEAVGFFPTQPRRAEVRLWDILWHLTGAAPSADPLARLHPAVRQTLQTIELRLGEPLSVSDLACAADLSHSHLTRLFRAEVGQTVIGYLQSRRVERARHLLAYSTLPPKTIAVQVGLPDLQAFNKTIRRALSQSPRAFREAAQNKVQ